jgi:hypothetical protein
LSFKIAQDKFTGAKPLLTFISPITIALTRYHIKNIAYEANQWMDLGRELNAMKNPTRVTGIAGSVKAS